MIIYGERGGTFVPAGESPPPPVVCQHRGEAVGEIKVDCLTCGGVAPLNVPAFKCGAFPHGRCLPGYIPPDLAKWQERPESALYHLCHGCERFSAATGPG